MVKPKKGTLSHEECDLLEYILSRFQDEKSMNLEMVDGYFAALNCSPDIISPSVFLPEIIGDGVESDDDNFEEQELQCLMELLTRHWNDISSSLSDSVFIPRLCMDPNEKIKGNDWAIGFLRGVNMGGSAWDDLFEDKEHFDAMTPFLVLASENHPDLEKRFNKEPISDENREDLIIGLVLGTREIYDYFEARRSGMARSLKERKPVQNKAKIGRNDSCSCGSGRKYKKCCGKTTVSKKTQTD